MSLEEHQNKSAISLYKINEKVYLVDKEGDAYRLDFDTLQENESEKKTETTQDQDQDLFAIKKVMQESKSKDLDDNLLETSKLTAIKNKIKKSVTNTTKIKKDAKNESEEESEEEEEDEEESKSKDIINTEEIKKIIAESVKTQNDMLNEQVKQSEAKLNEQLKQLEAIKKDYASTVETIKKEKAEADTKKATDMRELLTKEPYGLCPDKTKDMQLADLENAKKILDSSKLIKDFQEQKQAESKTPAQINKELGIAQTDFINDMIETSRNLYWGNVMHYFGKKEGAS